MEEQKLQRPVALDFFLTTCCNSNFGQLFRCSKLGRLVVLEEELVYQVTKKNLSCMLVRPLMLVHFPLPLMEFLCCLLLKGVFSVQTSWEYQQHVSVVWPCGHVREQGLLCLTLSVPVDSGMIDAQPLFSSLQNSKTLQDFPSHRIFERMHEVLNVAKQNN